MEIDLDHYKNRPPLPHPLIIKQTPVQLYI